MSSDTPPASTTDPARTWKRPFFTLWVGQSISLLGSGLVQFALVWWLSVTTHSATVLTTAVLVAILPGVFLAPVAGVWVDRLDRRRVMIVSDSLVALATVGLAVLFALDRVQVWHVYVALCVRGAAGAFQLPAAQASISLMVPETHLARVQGFNQMLQGLLTVASPPLGALLLGLLPMQGVLAIDAVTALVGIGSLLVVAVPRPVRPAAGEAGVAAPSFWSDMREGLAYVRGWSGLMAILIMATVINFFLVAAASLMPILVTVHFGGQMMHLATLESIFGGGAIIGGVTLGVWGGFRPRILTSLAGLVGIGIGFLLMGLTPANRFGLGLASAFLAAAMIPMANGPILAVLQATVTPGMQGRVFSLVTGVVTAIAPVGLAVAGPMADWLGVQAWYVAGGVVCAGMGIAGFFIPAIRRIEEHVQSPVVAPESPVTTV